MSLLNEARWKQKAFWREQSSLRRRGHGDKGYRTGRLGRKVRQEATWTEAMVAGDRASVEG